MEIGAKKVEDLDFLQPIDSINSEKRDEDLIDNSPLQDKDILYENTIGFSLKLVIYEYQQEIFNVDEDWLIDKTFVVLDLTSSMNDCDTLEDEIKVNLEELVLEYSFDSLYFKQIDTLNTVKCNIHTL